MLWPQLQLQAANLSFNDLMELMVLFGPISVKPNVFTADLKSVDRTALIACGICVARVDAAASC